MNHFLLQRVMFAMTGTDFRHCCPLSMIELHCLPFHVFVHCNEDIVASVSLSLITTKYVSEIVCYSVLQPSVGLMLCCKPVANLKAGLLGTVPASM